MSRDYLPYLKTLRRIPAPIIQAMATRKILPQKPESCLCGWAVREAMAFANGETADQHHPGAFTEFRCQENFGGDVREWCHIYFGITDDRHEAIETAFAIRVAECVR